MNQHRENLRTSFIKDHGWHDATVSFLAGDASNRTYYRLEKSSGEQAVLMDAYGETEKVKEFIEIDHLLEDLGCSVPRILGQDLETRFILLEDLGDQTFTQCLKEGMAAEPLYTAAVDTLVEVHQKFDITAHPSLPTYDLDHMLEKVNLFLTWYYPYVHGCDLTPAIRESWEDAWRKALKILEPAPKTLILRDYHVDNLLWLPDRQGIKRCGLLDFQDANLGPTVYDLVSLFEDVRLDVCPAITEKLLDRYLKNFPILDKDMFMAQYYTAGAQRIVRILGVFLRIFKQTQRDHYLQFLPRAWKWLENDLKHGNLGDIHLWFEEHFPSGKRDSH